MLSPNYLTDSRDDSDRLFVVQQPGQIGIIENGAWLPTPFLDVSYRMPALDLFGLDFDERGLLGLAFHPDFSYNGKLFTFTSESSSAPADFTLPPVDPLTQQSVIAEWQVDGGNANAVDVTSRKELIRIDNSQFNHNGGAISFGHDGNLYIAIGDGGAGNDVAPRHTPVIGNGQDSSNVLVTMLRIFVDGTNSANGQYGIPAGNPFTLDTGTSDEVYATGFRNPYRIGFDSDTG